MTSTLPPLVQAFSGSLGSAAANAASYPLDLVTTRLQTTRSKRIRGIKGAFILLRQILKRHGPAALYDGLNTDTGATVLSGFFYYYFYSFLRSLLARKHSSSKAKGKIPALSVAEELSLGFVAGLASRLISTPFSVVTIRLQTEREDADEEEGSGRQVDGEKERGVTAAIGRIYDEEGLLGFWRGFSSNIPLALTPSLTLFLFQLFRRLFLPQKNRDAPTPGQAFVGGAVSQSIAVTLLYPLILAKTRIQTARASSTANTRSPNILQLWATAFSRDGVPGLYQGLEAQVVKGVVSQGVTMMVKTRIEQLIVQAYLRRATRRLQ